MKVEPGIYEHYKGNRYLVIGMATHTETGEEMVLYTPLYWPPKVEGKHAFFVRPAAMFAENVTLPADTGSNDTGVVPRFRRIGDA